MTEFRYKAQWMKVKSWNRTIIYFVWHDMIWPSNCKRIIFHIPRHNSKLKNKLLMPKQAENVRIKNCSIKIISFSFDDCFKIRSWVFTEICVQAWICLRDRIGLQQSNDPKDFAQELDDSMAWSNRSNELILHRLSILKSTWS